MKIDGFLAAMLCAVGLAVLAPSLGASGGPLQVGLLTEIGIAAVFFLHGTELSAKALKAGAANWRLHLFVHASTFMLFPAIGFVIFTATRGFISPEVRLGIFYLCALSSTISSSVAMTSLGRGNVPGAVFDATLSGLLGMVLTPLLMGLVSVAGAKPIPLGPAVIDVALKLLAPFAAGHLLRPVIGDLVHRYKPLVMRADRSVIVLIVYGAFCDSTAAGLWSRYGVLTIAEILVAVALLLALVLTATTWGARAAGFSREDEVAAVFCGSKKSLANGAPIAKILFGATPSLGMIVLPLMLYHQLQLIVCSALARRYAARAEAEVGATDRVAPRAAAEAAA
jgi:solute carrier family 10 (sodium/bile acid cotransporter), member 7